MRIRELVHNSFGYFIFALAIWSCYLNSSLRFSHWFEHVSDQIVAGFRFQIQIQLLHKISIYLQTIG